MYVGYRSLINSAVNFFIKKLTQCLVQVYNSKERVISIHFEIKKHNVCVSIGGYSSLLISINWFQSLIIE